MKFKDRKELRRNIAGIILGTDTRDAAITAENIVQFLESQVDEYQIDRKISELRNKMIKFDSDFEGMQELQAKIEVLKEIIGDESEDNIESNWFEPYGVALHKRIVEGGRT